MIRQLHIGILVERRYLTQAQPAGMIAALLAKEHHVTVVDPGTDLYKVGNDDWLGRLDVIVARGRSWALLSLLAWAEARGIPTINRKSAIAAVHNKADMAVALASENIPTPRTFLSATERLASQVTSESYPLILKPIFGDNCQGLRVVDTPGELSQLTWPEPVALAQEYLPNDGYDLKLYGIGDEVWAVRKPSPLSICKTQSSGGFNHQGVKIEQIPLTAKMRDLGHCCGNLFGLDLYGVDCIQTADGPIVIEVNDFPTYTGVPGADEKLAEYVIRQTL